jgi:Uma2 family endonuclease
MTVTHVSGLEPKRWTRAEYEQMIEHDLFRPEERVELVDGEILTMAPQHSPHAATVMHIHEILRETFRPGFHVRVQMPFALDPMSEPEPDLAVVEGTALDYVHGHPDAAALLVEVADTTLLFARAWKASLYARAGIPEYWIVNLGARQLEVHRDPEPAPSARYGWAYGTVRQLGAEDEVSPLAAPEARIAVADLLP